MGSVDVGSDSDLNKGRHETDAERLDRNWDELLQELRVTQTGVQLLAGFLLTLPFQQRFTQIPEYDRVIFLIAFALAVLSTSLLVAPVSAHRLLFRLGAKDTLVDFANRSARVGLLTLSLTVVAVIFLIFDVVVGLSAAITASVVAALVFLVSWVAVPLSVNRRHRR